MNSRFRITQIILLIVDGLTILLGVWVGHRLWLSLFPLLAKNPESQWAVLWTNSSFISPLWIISALMFFWMWRVELYNPYKYYASTKLAQGVTQAGAFLLISVVFLEFLLPSREYARYLILLVSTGITISVLFGRLIFFNLQSYLDIHLPKQRFAVIGLNDETRKLTALLCGQWSHVSFCGYINPENDNSTETETLGKLQDLPSLVNKNNLDTIVIGPEELSKEGAMKMAITADQMGLRVLQVPLVWGFAEPHISLHKLGRVALIDLNTQDYPNRTTQIKRAIDLILCFTGGVLLFPFLFFIAMAIKLHDHGPIIFVQSRTGKGGREFPFYKFRTMVVDAETQREGLQDANEVDGPLFKMKSDPRITRLGSILRKSSLDELPQIWNVIRGDMNLVGPRPLPVSDLSGIRGDLEAEFWYEQRVKVKPGITGLWQVSGRSELGFKEMIRYDMEYIRNWSLWLDISILLKTIPAVLKRNGAH